MGKKNNPGIIWDDDPYEVREKKYKKKEKPNKQGIAEELDLSMWEEAHKRESRRANKKKDKDKYYDDYDDKWN